MPRSWRSAMHRPAGIPSPAPPPTSRSSPARITAAPAPAATPWSPPASPGSWRPSPTPTRWSAGRVSSACVRPASKSKSAPAPHEARELNIGFFSRMLRGTPWVRLKTAASLDGKTALAQRHQPMDHRRGRAHRRPCLARPRRRDPDRRGHRARRRPPPGRATGPTPRQPPLVVIDSRLQTPAGRPHLHRRPPVWIYAARDDPARQRRARSAQAPPSASCRTPGQGRPGRHAARPGPRAKSTSCMSKPATSSTAR